MIGDPDRLAGLTAYKLRATTPLLGQALDLHTLFGVDVGGRDFFGVTVPTGPGAEIGAAEFG